MSERYVPRIADDLPGGERPMVARLVAVPGHEAALDAAIATLTAAVRREPGCTAFRPYRDVANPGTFYLFESYADLDAFREHLATAHVARFFEELARHSSSDAAALVQLTALA